MKTKSRLNESLKHCRIVTAAILLAGFGTAVIIYLFAGEIQYDPFAEFEKTKKFAHELERMGGKTALVANDFSKWFAGLWQGKLLAYTVAAMTCTVAAGYYFIATGLLAEARFDRSKIGRTKDKFSDRL